MFSVLFDVSFGESEIDGEYFVGISARSDEEIIWFNISVEEMFGVDVLDSLEELVGEHEDCFDAELPVTVIEEFFQGGSKKIHDHNIIIAFCGAVVDVRDSLIDDTGVSQEILIKFTFEK